MNETATTKKTRMFPKPIKAMLPIAISAAKAIALKYGYDQVVILARRIGNDPLPHGEHITTFGRDQAHCNVAALMGRRIATLCQWPNTREAEEDIADWESAIMSVRDSCKNDPEAYAHWNRALERFNVVFPIKKP